MLSVEKKLCKSTKETDGIYVLFRNRLPSLLKPAAHGRKVYPTIFK
jgi:hypothetical protein